MPFHQAPFRAATTGLYRHKQWPLQWLPQQQQQHKLFHTSRPVRDDSSDDKNHYETLNVNTDASHAEIKKSFYTLSKTHHPDHNRTDPSAPRRFMKISEAYHVLSHADRRARYDRDTLRLHSSHQHHAARRAGSYSSTGPAGGRPASGLSRRRGTFTGPPPSFYRSGGWGAHSAKRRASHEESTGTGGGGSGAGMGEGAAAAGGGMGGGGGGGAGAGGVGGGMGPGQDPLHRTGGASHFDHERHERMHRRRDEARRRAASAAQEGVPVVDTGLWMRFVVISGIVAGAIYIPWWISQRTTRTTQKKRVG